MEIIRAKTERQVKTATSKELEAGQYFKPCMVGNVYYRTDLDYEKQGASVRVEDGATCDCTGYGLATLCDRDGNDLYEDEDEDGGVVECRFDELVEGDVFTLFGSDLCVMLDGGHCAELGGDFYHSGFQGGSIVKNYTRATLHLFGCDEGGA